ncbi:MAG: GIY-YIG nuclease family protein [Bacteroidales bacterium]|nr:GIY-YIG nuclease family protein [Bacteroidales bacterium]
MWSVYVIRSEKTGILYTGITQDIGRRLIEHNSGKAKFTSGHKPWKLVYIEEGFSELVAARKREKYLKNGVGRRFLRKRLGME